MTLLLLLFLLLLTNFYQIFKDSDYFESPVETYPKWKFVVRSIKINWFLCNTIFHFLQKQIDYFVINFWPRASIVEAIFTRMTYHIFTESDNFKSPVKTNWKWKYFSRSRNTYTFTDFAEMNWSCCKTFLFNFFKNKSHNCWFLILIDIEIPVKEVGFLIAHCRILIDVNDLSLKCRVKTEIIRSIKSSVWKKLLANKLK